MIEAEAQYRDWMLAGLAGDAAAYRRLLAALSGHLRSFFARRVGPSAAEDLVQETLIAIHTKRETYEASLPLTAWVYGIARYKLIDEYRREKRKATVPLDEAPELFARDEAEAAGRGVTWRSCWRNCPPPSGRWSGRSSWTGCRWPRWRKNRHVAKRGEGQRTPRDQIAGR